MGFSHNPISSFMSPVAQLACRDHAMQELMLVIHYLNSPSKSATRRELIQQGKGHGVKGQQS